MAEVATNQEPADSPSPNVLIARFLEENAPEYRRLAKLQQQGWANPQADQHFEQQRQNADHATDKTARYFYHMMQRIAQQMHQETQVLELVGSGSGPLQVMDFCAAPGGFLSEVLRLNPDACARAFSLPVSEGGHRLLMPSNLRAKIEYLDVTMLAVDMAVNDIPDDHPDAKRFIGRRRLQPAWKYDLILCDGHVLRTHNRATYREQCEARRLGSVQLALGLQHVRQRGSMVMLLHKLDKWDTVATIFRFSRFSTIRLFKPSPSHAKRSSFYLIATDISVEHEEAVMAMNVWRDVWRSATFDGENSPSTSITDGLDVHEVLTAFGSTLVELGRPIWSIQANALAEAPYNKPKRDKD